MCMTCMSKQVETSMSKRISSRPLAMSGTEVKLARTDYTYYLYPQCWYKHKHERGPRQSFILPLHTMAAAAAQTLYQYSWFSPGFARYRRAALRSYVLSNVANWIIMWISLAVVYGAYFKNNQLGKLPVYVVDFDGSTLGAQVVDAFRASLAQPNHFKLIFDAPFTSNAEVRHAVYDEKAWGAVVVNRGATDALQSALASGNASYDPASAIEVISEGARNALTANSHVVPNILAILAPVVTAAAENATAAFLSAHTDDPAALQTALRCPRCLATAYAYTQTDLRPADNASAFGAVLSGAIALIVFTFTVAGTSNTIGLAIGEHLNIPSTIVWRILNCLVAYLFISLSITGVQAAFGIPVTVPFGGRGFIILWMLFPVRRLSLLHVRAMALMRCSCAAFGYALEAIVTTFGIWINNWFLNFWVFWNSAAASYSAELMPGFYLYDLGFPLVHAIQGTSTIMYGTKSHLATNFGVLAAWTVGWAAAMSVATIVKKLVSSLVEITVVSMSAEKVWLILRVPILVHI
ncbi:hypothetical protein IEO21_00802 [Rhodonia placenta]|uniref:DUF3533 domain-containing protein n=1 Tax=Rhodonia placenta TaxID=104341 RepID=A0A8H7U641_9APHY|nr:hypothetical protein IEO21_00802 [Postia placenta]